MIRTNETTMLTRDEYKALALKVIAKESDDIAEKTTDPILKIGLLATMVKAIKSLENELFAEEEK